MATERCPKCLTGRLFESGYGVTHTEDGQRFTEATCLQCGYVTYPTPPLPLVREYRPPKRQAG